MAELKVELEAAHSIDEMIEAFKMMESRFQEKENAALECWKMAHEFHNKGQNPEKVISFGKRALNILKLNNQNDYRSTMFVSCVLNLLGFASLDLKRYDESLDYLNWADRNLCKLDQECNSVLVTLLATQLCLFRVKFFLGKKEEAAVHLEKVLSIKEKTMDEGCVELGEANRDVCYAYTAVMDFKAALPFGLKALEILMKHVGYNSMEIAEIRRFLGVFYSALGEFDKALELHQSSISVFKSMGHSSEVMMQAEIERGNMLIGNGKYEEAVKSLKAVVSNVETKEAERGMALVYLARAFCYMENFEKAKKYLKIAQEILGKKEIKPILAAGGFENMSEMYEMMGDFETALSLLMRVLTNPDLPQKLLVDGSTRLFSLIMLAGKEKERISYLEDVLEKLKSSLGPEHSQVGYCYVNMGISCWNSSSLLGAIKYFTLAKDVMDISIGPNHFDSLKTSQKLSVVYTILGRYDEAIEIQEKVIEGLKGMVPTDQAFLDEAVRLLVEIKERKNSWCSIL